jgi:hypothetical protein
LRRLLELNRFEIELLSYANFLLFPLELAYRVLSQVLLLPGRGSDLQTDGGALAPLLQAVLSCEARLLRHVRFPFGLSVIAVGRKRPADG